MPLLESRSSRGDIVSVIRIARIVDMREPDGHDAVSDFVDQQMNVDRANVDDSQCSLIPSLA
ncbi:MAG: hypothetical protein M3Y69_01860, partial [Verrucomicrobiota bacterium]|nr:hypothetical protein [Verrucomicrobiota bacterium]